MCSYRHFGNSNTGMDNEEKNKKNKRMMPVNFISRDLPES